MSTSVSLEPQAVVPSALDVRADEYERHGAGTLSGSNAYCENDVEARPPGTPKRVRPAPIGYF
jgi:hypothetical protein